MHRPLLLVVSALLLQPGCGGSGGSSTNIAPMLPELIVRESSPHELAPPYLDDIDAFWARSDIYVMRPDVEPLDRWPDEVLAPLDHSIRIIVMLPGDYRGRSNGTASDGWLYIPQSGTATEPILVVYSPTVGADILAEPHPAERLGQSEAQLIAVRVIGNAHQFFHGLTFADGYAPCLLHGTSHCVFDRCLWHEVLGQPLRIRFDARSNMVQRCVFRRFERTLWGHGDNVAIQVSDGVCTHNQIVSNVILNYTDSYQHTDRDGDPYGLGAGTLIDNNVFGFTSEAYLQEGANELLCGENAIDLKMGGTQAEPVMVTNNVFFGARASKVGCAASGSGGYAVTLHRLGTWIHMEGNLFVDNDSALFLNSMFLNADPAQGRINPEWRFVDNVFTGVRSYADAFPSRTGRVMSGLSPALFESNWVMDSDRLMDTEPASGPWSLDILSNQFVGPIVLYPRNQGQLEADGNVFVAASMHKIVRYAIPWHDRELEFKAPR